MSSSKYSIHVLGNGFWGLIGASLV